MSLPKAFTVALKQNSLGALRQEVFENCRKSSVTTSMKVFTPDLFWIPTNDDGLEKVAICKIWLFRGYISRLSC